MPHVEVWVDTREVLSDIDDDDLRKELADREKRKRPIGCEPETDEWLIDQIYEHYRLRIGEAPRCLSEFIYRRLGKVI